MTVQDIILREFTVPVTQGKVWESITKPEHLSRWFGESCSGTIAVGEIVLLGWEDEICRIRIEAMEPETRFAYSWQPGSDEDRSAPFEQLHRTLVEFFLEPIEGGTRVTMRESGFASLPEHMRAGVVADNSWGWDIEMADLATYLRGLEEA